MILSRFFVGLCVLLFLKLNVDARQTSSPDTANWHMAPIHMQTRWAKDVNPNKVLPEYPRPQMERSGWWKNLNGLWQYAITSKEDNNAPSRYTGNILVPFPIESALSGVGLPLTPDQFLWYKQLFLPPPLKPGEQLILHFEAVDWQTTVFVNGKEVGQHKGGYQHFSYNITDYLKNGANEMVVKVWDPTDSGPNPYGKQSLQPRGISYTSSSGIWQTVWLEKVPVRYITNITTTPDVDKGVLSVDVNISIPGSDVTVEVDAISKGKVIKKIVGHPGTTLVLPVKNARLWSPDDPFLYNLSVKLIQGGRKIDQISSYFGMRKITIQKDEKGIERIFLNNKPIYNLGTLDQGFWPDGLYTAPTDEALAFDIKAIKAMGFNTIRKHIKIEPARWYYHADKIGIMVWQDFVCPASNLTEDAKENFEKESQEDLVQLHNYPSIILWVLFNEHWGSYDQKRLTEWVKASDPSRLVDGHSGEILYIDGLTEPFPPSPWVSSDLADIHTYPSPLRVVAPAGKATVIGEFGGIGVSVPGHQWTDLKGWGYIQLTPNAMKSKYVSMIEQLDTLKKGGLSGSIYTQPFDVEGEENGLLTYDREIIKIPIEELQKVHQSLLPQTKGFRLDTKFVIAKNIDVNDTDERYAEFLKEFDQGKRDSVFLRRLSLMAFRQKDQSNVTNVGNIYIGTLKNPYSKENLPFIQRVTRTSKDIGFELYWNQPGKVDAILGNGIAEGKVIGIIDKEELPQDSSWKENKPDWDAIERKVINKYGALGEELVWGQRMLYYKDIEDWNNYGKYFVFYFERAGYHSRYSINNTAWLIFKHIMDPKVLEIAAKWSRVNIEKFDKTPNAIDTYANILYKLGKTADAIEWEEKAIQIDSDKKWKDVVEKMKSGKPTWEIPGI